MEIGRAAGDIFPYLGPVAEWECSGMLVAEWELGLGGGGWALEFRSED
jgi:hypothetical protein